MKTRKRSEKARARNNRFDTMANANPSDALCYSSAWGVYHYIVYDNLLKRGDWRSGSRFGYGVRSLKPDAKRKLFPGPFCIY